MSKRARVGILLSGRGSNFLALHTAMARGEIPAEVVVVLSNKPDAPGIEKARGLGLPAAVVSSRGRSRRSYEEELVEQLRQAEVDWVCLAGFMKILSPRFIEAYPERILNIHPSLLPAFPGLKAQEQAWDYGVAVSGCTVHLVDQGMDTGPIVVQDVVDIQGAAGPEEVAARILEREHVAYPAALNRLLSEPWKVVGRRVEFG